MKRKRTIVNMAFGSPRGRTVPRHQMLSKLGVQRTGSYRGHAATPARGRSRPSQHGPFTMFNYPGKGRRRKR